MIRSFFLFLVISGIFMGVSCSGSSVSDGTTLTSSLSSSTATVGGYSWIDVHGAGAQRCEFKAGNPANYAGGFGPQGDAVRIYNYVRMVRGTSASTNSYPVTDTRQTNYYDNNTLLPGAPGSTSAFYGQDAQYSGLQPSYADNGDGTVSDLSTGLMWVQDCGSKMTYAQALAGAVSCAVGAYHDWRLPTVKELYSLILFTGADVTAFIGDAGVQTDQLIPFIDTDYFRFNYGSIGGGSATGERLIDAQYITCTTNIGTTGLSATGLQFGVNFPDGRIKSYPRSGGLSTPAYYVKYVRGNTDYGKNTFTDNGDGTIQDKATGLIWARDDSGKGLNWEQALAWVASNNSVSYCGYSDWRLPDAKELQSIVDYSRSLSWTGSPAIAPVFHTSPITNEGGELDYPYYWTGTTHLAMTSSYTMNASEAVYISFGLALGYFSAPQ